MKRILIAITMILTCSVQAQECSFTKDLSVHQKRTLEWAFERGKEYDLSYTLAAIAFRESSLGENLVNLQDPSFGIFHITIQTAANVLDRDISTNFAVNKLASDLLDPELNVSIAIETLQYWDTQRDSWADQVASYNNGWLGRKTPKGRSYYRQIKSYVKQLKQCKLEVFK